MFNGLSDEIYPETQEQGSQQILGKPLDPTLKQPEYGLLPPLHILQGSQPEFQSQPVTQNVTTDDGVYKLFDSIEIDSTIHEKRYETIVPILKPTAQSYSTTFRFNLTGWTPMKSLCLEIPVNYSCNEGRAANSGVSQVSSCIQSAMTVLQIFKDIRIRMGNNEYQVGDGFQSIFRMRLYAMIREKTKQEIMDYYGGLGLPRDQIIPSADFNKSAPSTFLNPGQYWLIGGEDYSTGDIFSKAWENHWGMIYHRNGDQACFVKKLLIPLYLLFPSMDETVLLPPGLPFNIDLSLDPIYYDQDGLLTGTDYFSNYSNVQRCDALLYFHNGANSLTAQPDKFDNFFMRYKTLVIDPNMSLKLLAQINQMKSISWFSSSFSNMSTVYGDGSKDTFVIAIQPYMLLPTRLVIVPYNNDREYSVPNPLWCQSPTEIGGGMTETMVGLVKQNGILPYRISYIKVEGSSGKVYYLYEDRMYTNYRQQPLCATFGSYENIQEHLETLARHPGVYAQGLHQNITTSYATGKPYIIDLSNAISTVANSKTYSVNQMIQEQLKVTITISTVAQLIDNGGTLAYPDPKNILAPLARSHAIAIHTMYSEQTIISAGLNVSKASAPVVAN